MKYYLLYNSKNEIIGYSNCLNIIDGVECREVSKEEYENYLSTINVPTQKDINKNKIAELKQWFDTEYRYKDEKYNRLIVLGKTDDDGVSAEVKRKDLYEEAEKVRKQIQELEKLI